MPVFRVPATITYPQGGSPGVNVWSVRTTEGSVVIDELDSALTALQAFYNSLSAYLAPSTQVVIGPDIMDRESSVDQTRPSRTIGSTVSSGTAAPVLQLVISWRTELRARRGMGRTFFGPLASVAVEGDGTPNTTFLNAARTAAADLISASNTANGWGIGVWGLVSPGTYDANGQLLPGLPHVHRDITSARVKDQFAVLRSRRD
jgi:hypothetical protein